jgi:L-ascorbate metabolism protein UlaG (beta-lactamase superfamily)
MRITKYEHACLLVEDGAARLLIDPGIYTPRFETLEGITAVLVTHGHADHVDIPRVVALAAANPGLVIVADEASAMALAEAGLEARAVHAGDRVDLGIEVVVHGQSHTPIHADIPAVPNVALEIGGRLFHPGDSFTRPPAGIEVLALPTGGPWLKLGEAIDYLRASAPRIAVPIHESVLARPAASIAYFEKLAPGGTEVRVLAVGDSLEI